MPSDKILKYVSFGCLAAVVVMMVAATVVERLHGTQAALSHFYHHPVFFLLWALMAVAGFWLLLRSRAGRKPFILGLHAALVLILIGALVTHLTGLCGEIHLRQGEEYSSFRLDEGPAASLPFSIRLEEFSIERYPGSTMPSDYRSEVTFLPERKAVTISMNHIGKYRGYRFYQADYDADGLGSILSVSHDPWGVGITYAGYLLLLFCMVGYFFEKDTAFRAALRHRDPARSRRIWTIALSAAAVAMLVVWLVGVFPKGPLMPVLRSPLLVIHVVPIIISYALFGLTAILGIVGLALPEGKAERLRDVSLVILFPGVFLLAFGTFLGGVWANISWGNYWAWDPKETWALVTLLVYAVLLHGSSLRFLQKPRFFHLCCVLAFLCVLVTYFGVNLLLGGMHSYA